MDGSTDDVEFLAASVRSEIATLKSDRRLQRAPEGNRGEALRQHVLDLLDAAEHWLTLKPDSGAPPHTLHAFSRSLRDLMLNLQAAHAAMPWLAATHSPPIDMGSLYLAEEFAEILVGRNVDLVIVPDPEYMYATESWPFKAIVDATPGFVAKTSRRPIVLHYPLSDGHRSLLHSIFGHELGHSATQERQLVASVVAEMQADDDYEEALGQLEASIWPGNPPGKTRRTVEAYLRCWVEELLCDHLAVAVAGPAYLWAFAGFALPLGYGDHLPTYPAHTVRVKLALEHLDALGWREHFAATAPTIAAWLSEVAADANEQAADHPFEFLRAHTLRRADLLRSTATTVVGSERLGPETIPEAEEAAGLLERLILPVGEDRPLSPRAILLGGWMHALAAHGDNPSGLVAALADLHLQELVGKAIEMSVVVRCWEKP